MVIETALRKVWKVPWIAKAVLIVTLAMLRRHLIVQPVVVRNRIFFELKDGSMCYQYEMLDLQRVMASYQDDHDNYAAEYKRRRFSQDVMCYQQPVWIPEMQPQTYYEVNYAANETHVHGDTSSVQDTTDIPGLVHPSMQTQDADCHIKHIKKNTEPKADQISKLDDKPKKRTSNDLHTWKTPTKNGKQKAAVDVPDEVEISNNYEVLSDDDDDLGEIDVETVTSLISSDGSKQKNHDTVQKQNTIHDFFRADGLVTDDEISVAATSVSVVDIDDARGRNPELNALTVVLKDGLKVESSVNAEGEYNYLLNDIPPEFPEKTILTNSDIEALVSRWGEKCNMNTDEQSVYNNICVKRWSYVERMTGFHTLIDEAIAIAEKAEHKQMFHDTQERLEMLRLEVLYSTDITHFYNIILEFEQIVQDNRYIIHIVNKLKYNTPNHDEKQNEQEDLKANLKHYANVTLKNDPVSNIEDKHIATNTDFDSTNDTFDIDIDNDVINVAEPTCKNAKVKTNDIPNTHHDEVKCGYHERYMELVLYTEEDIRDSIATSILTHPDRAQEYNNLMNASRDLNKIVPKKMTKELFESKHKKYERKVKNQWQELMLSHGYMWLP